MSLTPKQYINDQGVKTLTTGIKTWVLSDKSAILKKVIFKDNSIYFYNNPNATTEMPADFVVNLPNEYFLDQARTLFVPDFTWSSTTYPGSTNPNLEGDPVLVLAIKGSDNTVTYSFISMNSLVKIYTPSAETSTIKITIDNATNTIAGAVNISADEGNILKVGTDKGLYAPKPDLSGKTDKITESILEDQIFVDNGEGNIKASGITIQNIVDNMVPYTSKEVQDILDEILQ